MSIFTQGRQSHSLLITLSFILSSPDARLNHCIQSRRGCSDHGGDRDEDVGVCTGLLDQNGDGDEDAVFAQLSLLSRLHLVPTDGKSKFSVLFSTAGSLFLHPWIQIRMCWFFSFFFLPGLEFAKQCKKKRAKQNACSLRPACLSQ